jgi:predicted metal-dependent phosphoesterase TrpH
VIDLHTHSTASDGSYTPTELVALASQQGITKLALTDHDTVDGVSEAAAACLVHGVTFVPGIELSARWHSRTLHIVGLSVDPLNTTLETAISGAKQIRIDRAREIGDRLERAGVSEAYRHTREQAGTELLGRFHFAKMLVSRGYAKDFRQVFKRFMVRGKPGYASAEWMQMKTAIEIIHRAGGIAVMAHPARYSLSAGQLRKALEQFKGTGGDAMEVVCGHSNTRETENMARLANDTQLAASIGSDFHGPDKPWISLGRLSRLPTNCLPVWQSQKLW